MTPDELLAQTRETYDGPVVVGEDLMTFEIGKDGVATRHRMPKGHVASREQDEVRPREFFSSVRSTRMG